MAPSIKYTKFPIRATNNKGNPTILRTTVLFNIIEITIEMVTDISKFKSSTICFLNQGFSDDIKYPNNGENRPKKREHSVNITAKFFESLLIVSVGRASSVAFELGAIDIQRIQIMLLANCTLAKK